jgi:hypothetical protein
MGERAKETIEKSLFFSSTKVLCNCSNKSPKDYLQRKGKMYTAHTAYCVASFVSEIGAPWRPHILYIHIAQQSIFRGLKINTFERLEMMMLMSTLMMEMVEQRQEEVKGV